MPVEPADRYPFRVGYVVKKYPRLSETFVVDEILGLEAARVEVSVFSLRLPDEGRFSRDLSRVRSQVAYLPGFGSSATLEAFRALDRLQVPTLGPVLRFLDGLPEGARSALIVQAIHLADLASSLRLDHLHAHFMTVAAHATYLAHLLTGIPFTVTAHAKDVYRHDVDRLVFGVIASAAQAVVTVCEANRRFIEEELLADRVARVVRIYNGVFLDRLAPAEGPRDGRLILGVGRLVEKKGFHLLLEACALLARQGIDFRTLLIGDGDQRVPLLADRDRLGLADRVELLGALPRDEVLQLMGQARVLAAPCVAGSDGNQDALPTVLLEALARGLPAVTTPVGGIPEIIEDGVEGLLVPDGDPEALAEALAVALTDEPRWSLMAQAGPAKAAARFDRRANLGRLIDLFQGAVVGRSVERAGL
ncbi:MAG: glycosyltransferase [Acidimicrobiia bacterium]